MTADTAPALRLTWVYAGTQPVLLAERASACQQGGGEHTVTHWVACVPPERAPSHAASLDVPLGACDPLPCDSLPCDTPAKRRRTDDSGGVCVTPIVEWPLDEEAGRPAVKVEDAVTPVDAVTQAMLQRLGRLAGARATALVSVCPRPPPAPAPSPPVRARAPQLNASVAELKRMCAFADAACGRYGRHVAHEVTAPRVPPAAVALLSVADGATPHRPPAPEPLLPPPLGGTPDVFTVSCTAVHACAAPAHPGHLLTLAFTNASRYTRTHSQSV